MIKATEMMRDLNDAINNRGSLSVSKMVTFVSETETIQDNVKKIVKILSDGGFGPDDDDAQFDVITMLQSAMSDLEELRRENVALQSKIRDSKIFEKELMEG